MARTKPFKVVPLTMPPNEGKFACEGAGGRWGVWDEQEPAQAQADRLNEAVRLPHEEDDD